MAVSLCQGLQPTLAPQYHRAQGSSFIPETTSRCLSVASPLGAGSWRLAGTTLPGRTGVQGRAQNSMSQPLCCCNKDVSGWMAHKVECPQDRRAQNHSGAAFKRAPAPFLRAQPLPGPHHLPDPPSRTIPGWRGGVRGVKQIPLLLIFLPKPHEQEETF